MELSLDPDQHYLHTFESFPDSFVRISPSIKADCAIVFVHGYGGKAYDAWVDFHSMIDDYAPCADFYANCDLYFYAYSSRAPWINVSTDRLLRFVDRLILQQDIGHFRVDMSPTIGPRESKGRRSARYKISLLPSARQYNQIILVRHSEGGVVVRNAVIKRLKDKTASRRRLFLASQLSLFAPAIAGFRPTGFLGVLSKIPGIGDTLNAYFSKDGAFQDLLPRSDFLEKLKENTEIAARSRKSRALRARILWGGKDRIVHPTKYDLDSEEYEDTRGHNDICRPSIEYVRPLEFVSRAPLSMANGSSDKEGEVE